MVNVFWALWLEKLEKTQIYMHWLYVRRNNFLWNWSMNRFNFWIFICVFFSTAGIRITLPCDVVWPVWRKPPKIGTFPVSERGVKRVIDTDYVKSRPYILIPKTLIKYKMHCYWLPGCILKAQYWPQKKHRWPKIAYANPVYYLYPKSKVCMRRN